MPGEERLKPRDTAFSRESQGRGGVHAPAMKLSSLLLFTCGCLQAAEPLTSKGALLFSDDFERADLGEWKTVIPSFMVQNGVLKGWQTRDDHGAVGRVYRPMKDVVVEFKFMLDGSTGFNAVFDDKNHKGSHAGHICRVAFAPKQLRIGDDKEGVMRNDIFEMRKDPARKAEADALLAGRGSSVNRAVEPKKWHSVRIEILGDRLRVTMNGEPAGELKSPGIAHETKESLHFTVNGPGVLFDEVRIWGAAQGG